MTLPWTSKPIIGVIHLGPLPGQPNYDGIPNLLAPAIADARALAEGGAGALLVENWKDESPRPFVEPDTVAGLAIVLHALRAETDLPLGVNVLPNDYRAAFALANACDLAFVQLDVFTDQVKTDYTYSQVEPFEVVVDLDDVALWRTKMHATHVALLATVHPKHYAPLVEKPIEQSAREAVAHGADAVVVTGDATGTAPGPARVEQVRAAVDVPVIIGSGLAPDNAADLWPRCDGAIVGTSLKTEDFSKVEVERVRALIAALPA